MLNSSLRSLTFKHHSIIQCFSLLIPVLCHRFIIHKWPSDIHLDCLQTHTHQTHTIFLSTPPCVILLPPPPRSGHLFTSSSTCAVSLWQLDSSQSLTFLCRLIFTSNASEEYHAYLALRAHDLLYGAFLRPGVKSSSKFKPDQVTDRFGKLIELLEN